MNLNGYTFDGPYYYDRGWDNTFACVYAIISGNKVIYIGITDDINERLVNHHKRACWDRNCASVQSLYILKESSQYNREQIEKNLLAVYNTSCNDQMN